MTATSEEGPVTVSLQVELPGELHRQLKATAALNSMTLRAAVIQASAEWVDGHQPPQ